MKGTWGDICQKGEKAMRYFICYDISEDKVRRGVVKYLESFAHRLQYSVFSFECTAEKLERIKGEVLKLVVQAENPLILIAPICHDCEKKIWKVGDPKEKEQLYVIA